MDYNHTSYNLTFDTCDTRQCTEIPIVDDMIVELTESFFVTLEKTPGLDSRITLSPVNGEIEITNNDGVYYYHAHTWDILEKMDVHGLLHRGCGGVGEHILYSP